MAAPGPGSRKDPGLQAERSGWQPRSRRGPRRHIAALCGRERVMAETYGEGGEGRSAGREWETRELGPERMRPGSSGAELYVPGGGA